MSAFSFSSIPSSPSSSSSYPSSSAGFSFSNPPSSSSPFSFASSTASFNPSSSSPTPSLFDVAAFTLASSVSAPSIGFGLSKPSSSSPLPASSSAEAPVSGFSFGFGSSASPSTSAASSPLFWTASTAASSSPFGNSGLFDSTISNLLGSATPSSLSTSSTTLFGSSTTPNLYGSAIRSSVSTTSPTLFGISSSVSTSTPTFLGFSASSASTNPVTTGATVPSLFQSSLDSVSTGNTAASLFAASNLFGTSSSSGTCTAPFSSPLFVSSSASIPASTASTAPSFPNLFGSTSSSSTSSSHLSDALTFPATAAFSSLTTAVSSSSTGSSKFSFGTPASSGSQPSFGFGNVVSTVSVAPVPVFGASSSSSTAASTAASTVVSPTITFQSGTTSIGSPLAITSSIPNFVRPTKSLARASSTQAQSTPATPLFGVPTSTSAFATLSSASAVTTQTSASLTVASTSGTTTTVSATISSAPKLPSEITGKTIEEIIKEWNSELQERAGKFQKQANTVAEWDRRILQNRDILLRLETEVAKVVETQASLERQLELIETHQQEVDKALVSMEEEAEQTYMDERNVLLDDEAASTRDAMYEQAEIIEREMEQMAEQIKTIIQTLHASQGGELDAVDGMTPLDVVVRILNYQLSSLMWIDEKAEEFSRRIQKLASQGSAANLELMAPKYWLS